MMETNRIEHERQCTPSRESKVEQLLETGIDIHERVRREEDFKRAYTPRPKHWLWLRRAWVMEIPMQLYKKPFALSERRSN